MNAGEALLLTLAVEAPIVVACLRRPAGPSWPRVLAAATLPSCVTHPLAWRLVLRLGPVDYLAGVASIEVLVVLAEALLIRLCGVPALRALGIAALANGASFAAGWLLLR